jgi:hypothetical protein
MNIEQLRKIYLKTPIPTDLENNGWSRVKSGLDKRGGFNPRLIQRPIALFISLLLVLTVLTATVQAANPGDVLYPVKLLSDQIQAKVTNNPQKVIEKRAGEIVKMSDQAPEKVDRAVEEYQKAVVKTQTTVKEEDKVELKKTLSVQQERLEKIGDKHPEISDKVEKAIEDTKKAQGEIKGASRELPSSARQHEN